MTNFAPTNVSGVVTVATDSSETQIELTGATAILVSNPDAAIAVTIAFSQAIDDVYAVFPTDTGDGVGTVIAPGSNQILAIPQLGNGGMLYASFASLGGDTVDIYYSLGTFV
jgi:hypothetical protein